MRHCAFAMRNLNKKSLCPPELRQTHRSHDPVTTGTKRRAAIEKRQRAVTLITGGTGFLGSHLVRQLIEDGAKDVRVMATSIPDWLVDLGVETFAGSITNADDNKRAVEGISEIYHLAGKVSRERKDAREMYDIHVEGTRLLCDAAKAAGVKTIVLASTSGTIAVTKEGDVVPDETYPVPLDIISRWPYYASKAYQEMAALERFQGKGLRLVIMNPSLLLGPGDDRLSSTKLILDFMARKISAVPTGGVSFVDARDAAQTFSSRDEERPARRTIPARRRKLDLLEILRPARASHKSLGAMVGAAVEDSRLRAQTCWIHFSNSGTWPRRSSRARSRWPSISGI